MTAIAAEPLMREMSTMVDQPQKGSGAVSRKATLPPLEHPIAEPQGRGDITGSSGYGQDRRSASASFLGPQVAPLVQPVDGVVSQASSFQAIQKWQGYVTAIVEADGVFYAHLTTTLGEGDEQEAEIYLSAIDPADRDLLRVGAVFYWTVGYLRDKRGTRKAQILRFRRLPVVSRQQLDAAQEAAQRQRKLLRLPDLEAILVAHSNGNAATDIVSGPWRDE